MSSRLPRANASLTGILLLLLSSLLYWNVDHSLGQEPQLSEGQSGTSPGTSLPDTLREVDTNKAGPQGIDSRDGQRPELANREMTAREMATQILHRTLMESVWGKPVLCEVRQNIRMFDKKRSSFGKYVRGGQGSGKMRLSLQVPAGDQMNSLLQVGDGELLSTLLEVGDHSARSQVDLGKIRDRLTITTQSLQDPVVAIHLAVGGQAELLRKLCQQYQWNSVAEGRLGQRPVWWVKGEAAQQPPQAHGLAPIDIRLFEAHVGLQPSRATIAIGRLESAAPFWLFQVEETYRDSRNPHAQLSVSTEWDMPTSLLPSQLVPDLFRLGVSDNQALYESRDETKLYLPPARGNVAGVLQDQKLR